MCCKIILKTNDEFRTLIPPSTIEEYELLEQSILMNGCTEPICVWASMILDGHKRFEICTRHNLPYEIKQIHVKSSLEAMSWICTESLSKENLPDAYRTYLIGKKYLFESEIGRRTFLEGLKLSETHRRNRFTTIELRMILSREYNVHERTIFHYGKYAMALDQIRQSDPDLVNNILSGTIRINKYKLGKMLGSAIQELVSYCSRVPLPAEALSPVEKSINSPSATKKINLPTSAGAIKTMPQHDPDAEMKSLSLTMPSWVRSIQRILDCSSIEETTEDARRALSENLIAMLYASSSLLNRISRGNTHD